MPSSRRIKSSRRILSRIPRSKSKKESLESLKVKSNIRKDSENAEGLEKVTGSRCLPTKKSLRNYSKEKEHYKNLVKLGKRDKFTEKEQSKSKQSRSKLNKISLMRKNKAMQKVKSAKRSSSVTEMLKTSESPNAMLDAIESTELIGKSKLINKLAPQSRNRYNSATVSIMKTKEFCDKLANYTKYLRQKDMNSSDFNKKYKIARNYAKKLREKQINGEFGSGSRNKMIDNQIKDFNKLSDEIKNFQARKLVELRKSSLERQKRIVKSASKAAVALESKSLKSRIPHAGQIYHVLRGGWSSSKTLVE
ncbi:MAG: hypothetical protein MHPSP_003225 [Paramarteilia canceri]